MRKNGDAVVRAFAVLRSEHPAARLDLVGGHPRLDVPGVHGHGRIGFEDPVHRPHLEHLFAESTCFVMPSQIEPFGIAYVEAAAAGMPSIGTTVGGTATSVGDGGELVPPGDPVALLAAMRRMSEPGVARALGERALVRSAHFTWAKVAQRLVRATGLRSPDGGDLAEFL